MTRMVLAERPARSRIDARNKQNLVILVTPHIIKEGHDLQRLTEFRTAEFYNHNLDVVFEKDGFIKKIKKKQYLKNRFRPTERYREDRGSGKSQEFSRGDIKRY